MDLKKPAATLIFTPKKNLKTTEETESNEEERYKDSEIVLGSVLEVNKFENSISHSITPFENFPQRESVADKTESRSFRKNSENKIE